MPNFPIEELRTPEEYLLLAYQKAQESPDPSTQNGAVIPVPYSYGKFNILTACNTFPNGVQNKPERLVRPLKYHYVEHAERNVILLAARWGHPLEGCTMYVPWFACADCARAIIQSGIKKVIGHQRMFDETPERWRESIDEAFNMLHEAGVETALVKGELNGPEIRFNEKLWKP